MQAGGTGEQDGGGKLLGQRLLHRSDDAVELVPVGVRLFAIRWQDPPLVPGDAVHEFAVRHHRALLAIRCGGHH